MRFSSYDDGFDEFNKTTLIYYLTVIFLFYTFKSVSMASTSIHSLVLVSSIELLDYLICCLQYSLIIGWELFWMTILPSKSLTLQEIYYEKRAILHLQFPWIFNNHRVDASHWNWWSMTRADVNRLHNEICMPDREKGDQRNVQYILYDIHGRIDWTYVSHVNYRKVKFNCYRTLKTSTNGVLQLQRTFDYCCLEKFV